MKRNEIIKTSKPIGKPGTRDISISNEITELLFDGFKQRHLDLAVLMCVESRKHDTDEFIIKGERLRKVLGIKHKGSLEEFKKQLHEDCKILLHFETGSINGDFDVFNIFERFRYYKASDELHARFSRSGWELLLGGDHFLLASLNDYLKLSGFYARRLFLLLKRFRTKQSHTEVYPWGGVYLSWQDFRKVMSVPFSYKNESVKERVIKPALRQLRDQKIFQNLELRFIKDKSRRGHPLSHIRITFEPEPKNVVPGQLEFG